MVQETIKDWRATPPPPAVAPPAGSRAPFPGGDTCHLKARIH